MNLKLNCAVGGFLGMLCIWCMGMASAANAAPAKSEKISTVLLNDASAKPAGAAGTAVAAQGSPEDFNGDPWKGQPDRSDFDFGALTGLGFVQGSPAFALVGTASRKIDYAGFIDGIRNSLSIEGQLGPMFLKGSSAFTYSAHLRWDFKRDEIWTYYALGGLGGYVTGSRLGDQFALFPRFGVGAFWQISPIVRIRFELSHELSAVGVALPI